MNPDNVAAGISDVEKATDIEVVMRLLKLMGEPENYVDDEYRKTLNHVYVKMAENALQTMTNPFARELLLDRLRA